MQSALKEIVKLKGKGNVPVFEWLWNDLGSNEMFVQYLEFVDFVSSFLFHLIIVNWMWMINLCPRDTLSYRCLLVWLPEGGKNQNCNKCTTGTTC